MNSVTPVQHTTWSGSFRPKRDRLLEDLPTNDRGPLLPTDPRRASLLLVMFVGLIAVFAASGAEFTLLTEDFEGPFPAGDWMVGDQDPNGIAAYWDDVD